MSKLFFKFASMNAGKSTALIQVAYNYEERGQRAIIAKPSTDTKSDKVFSRLNVFADVNWNVQPGMDLVTLLDAEIESVDCILVDEAQFLQSEQVEQLFYIAVKRNIPVLAYGIRTDFATRSFPGSQRLLELAHSLEELKTICRCGKKALLNGRKIDGEFIREGSQVAIDGQQAEYESLCGECYIDKVGW